MFYRYYLTQRPPGPGVQPKDFVNVKDYGEKIEVVVNHSKTIQAWGYVEYLKPLSVREVYDYELREGGIHLDEGI